MSQKRAAGAGAGRKKLGGTPLSRLEYPCRVPSCGATFQSDQKSRKDIREDI